MVSKFFFIAALTAAFLGAVPTAEGQVLIYKIDFSDAKGINFHTFTGGYVVVPVLGGDASFLLTSNEQGKTYSESSGGGKLFTAVTGSGDQKAVLSATTGSGTASGSMVALGDIDHIFKVNSPTVTLAVRVATSLNGTLVSADDESTATSTAVDGSIGSAGVADVKLSLDETESSRANKKGLSVDGAMEVLRTELERKGYSAAATDTEVPATDQ